MREDQRDLARLKSKIRLRPPETFRSSNQTQSRLSVNSNWTLTTWKHLFLSLRNRDQHLRWSCSRNISKIRRTSSLNQFSWHISLRKERLRMKWHGGRRQDRLHSHKVGHRLKTWHSCQRPLKMWQSAIHTNFTKGKFSLSNSQWLGPQPTSTLSRVQTLIRSIRLATWADRGSTHSQTWSPTNCLTHRSLN